MQVIEDMQEFARIARDNSEAFSSQAGMLREIEGGVEQIAIVVQSNSTSAEETSATSEELSAQSDNLNELIGKFRIRQWKIHSDKTEQTSGSCRQDEIGSPGSFFHCIFCKTRKKINLRGTGISHDSKAEAGHCNYGYPVIRQL